MKLRTCVWSSIFAVALLACQERDPNAPNVVVSTEGSYAAEFAGKVARTTKDVKTREAKAKEDMGAMPTLPDRLAADAPWDTVLSVVEAADSAGRDGSYEEETRTDETVKQFFDDEKDALLKKVAGGAQFAAKQKGCEVDIWGAVSQGMKDGIDERIKERLRNKNDAFLVIDRNRDALGKKNATMLEEDADKISEASFIVHVDLKKKKLLLDAYVEQVPKMRSTLQNMIDEEKAWSAKEKPKPEAQKASDERIKAWQTKLAALDPAEQEARANQKDMEQRISALESDYSAAFSAMKDAIKAKKK